MNPKVLKRGSVWALCLLLVIIRIAFFCSLYKRVEQVPKAKIPYVKCGKIRLLYNTFRMNEGR